MAYAALVSLAQTTDLILNHDKYSISVDAREKIVSIHEYTTFLLSSLEDFPEKLSIRLEGQIRDVANEAEDIIEDFMWKQSRISQLTVELRTEFERQLKKVREEIGLIAGEMMDDRVGGSAAATSSSRLVPTDNDVVIGLDGDLMAIRDRLLGESSKLQVLAIVGMGGIGKTTLARYVYDDPLVVKHFDIRAGVTVSQACSAEKILSNLLVSMNLFNEDMFGQENELIVLGEKVHKSLMGRRYLIVLDDIWNTMVWDNVRKMFPDDKNGSRIILTTRLSNVAAYASSCGPLYEMRFMDENQSWNLLKRKVFTNGQGCPLELEYVGKEIARSCKGLPLAVVLVAGILSTVAKTRSLWGAISKNVDSVFEWRLQKILSLSYTHLPHHLRSCFLFIGGFPEDYTVHVSKLIKLWVAEGFLKRQNEYKSLEEEAEGYLEDLVKRNLVMVTSRKANGKIKCCSVHDLVRDLCIRKAQEEKFLHVIGKYVLPSTINERHISIACSDHLRNIRGPAIHTILCFQTLDYASLAFLIRFRLIRVLDVVNDVRVLLPFEIFELFHLRYLAFRYFTNIPSAIANLENLQTLIIHPGTKFQNCLPYDPSLPLEIWRLPHLRHLVFFYLYQLHDPVDESSLPLENLQTLSSVANLICTERILKRIPNLKKLGIIYWKDQPYQLHNLVYLRQLEKLKVLMLWGCSWQRQNPAFPTTLKRLTLIGGRLPWRDMVIVGSLPNLEMLKLRGFACGGDTWEISDGEFPQLKFLLIEKSDLQDWIAESSYFPSLKCLVLQHCLNLREIPEGIGEIPTLELIEVDDLNLSLVVSAKQIQEDQQNYGNYVLQVRCIYYERKF